MNCWRAVHILRMSRLLSDCAGKLSFVHIWGHHSADLKLPVFWICPVCNTVIHRYAGVVVVKIFFFFCWILKCVITHVSCLRTLILAWVAILTDVVMSGKTMLYYVQYRDTNILLSLVCKCIGNMAAFLWFFCLLE